MKHLLILLCLSTSSLLAQESVTPDDLAFADEVLESPTLNINGKIAEEKPAAPKMEEVVAPKPVMVTRKPLTASQKMVLYRAKLEERNRQMVQKKMEEIRLRQEIMLMKQLEAQMNKTLKAIESVE